MGAELEALINMDESGLQGMEDIRDNPTTNAAAALGRIPNGDMTVINAREKNMGRARKTFTSHSCKLALVLHSAVRILYDFII